MSGVIRSFAARAVLSGILLGLSFPPSPISSLAFIALIPFLSLLDSVRSGMVWIRLSYAFLVSFHVTTVYWTGGFTHGHDQWMMIAGAALLFLHPWFMMPFLAASWWIRKRMGALTGYASFVSFWLMFEFFHERGELSFPWMAIGNSQSYDLYRIQIAEIISVQGIGLHVLVFNVLAYMTIRILLDGTWEAKKRKSQAILTLMAVIYLLPLLYGWIRIDAVEKRPVDRMVQIGIIQPNVDPWEKWGSRETTTDVWTQIAALDSMTRQLPEGSDLVVWPETAIPTYVRLPNYHAYADTVRSLAQDEQVNILAGFPHAKYFAPSDAPVTSKPVRDGSMFVESYNSAGLFYEDGGLGPVYGKVVLVPFAERLPHAELLSFLIEPLRWNVGISSWGKGRDTTIYRIPQEGSDSASFAAMICYESVYPSYVREFVRKGAEFLVVITNNSWWDRTSGPYQHAAYASLRAVEHRRWVVQCANGGVSTIVHPSGRPLLSTGLFEQAAFVHVVGRETERTFYTEYGDIVGTGNVVCAIGLMLFTLIRSRRSGEEL